MALREAGQPVGEPGGMGLDHVSFEETLQVVGHRAGRGVAAVGIVRQALFDDGAQVGRQGGRLLGQRRRLAPPAPSARWSSGVRPGKGKPPLEHLVEGDAQAEDVGPAVDRPPCRQPLGRHVLRRSRRLLVGASAWPADDGDAEVADPGPQLPFRRAADQDVRRLDVEVQQAAAVRRVQPGRPPAPASPPAARG